MFNRLASRDREHTNSKIHDIILLTENNAQGMNRP